MSYVLCPLFVGVRVREVDPPTLLLLQDTDEGHNKSNDNPANSAQGKKTSSGTCIRTRMVNTPTDLTNNNNQDGVSNSTHIVSLT